MVSTFKYPAATFAGLALGACAWQVRAAATLGPSNPITFFIGHTHGDAELHKLFSRSINVRVDGVGRELKDILVLDQTTREGSKAPRARRWVMRKLSANTYSGTLTDASGPVTIIVRANRAVIRYPMKGGLTVRQELAVQSDGRTMLNDLTVTKFGIRVATLKETIRKLD